MSLARVATLAAASVAASSFGAASCADLPVAGARPNILLIVVDDLGYGDVGCFRGEHAWAPYRKPDREVAAPATPRLDQLAATGRMLTAFYANCSVCSPTRAALLTGRYQHRSGVVNVLGQLGEATAQIARPGETPFTGLSPDELTMADVLRAAGYRTAAIGKWHLGKFENGHHPLDFGFDTYVGAEAGAGNNFSLKTPGGRSLFYRDREVVDAPGYWYTDVLADEAIRFMTDSPSQPFFTYLAFTAPHLPLFGPNDRELANAWDQKGATGPREDLYQAYKEVVEGLDAAVGRVYDALVAAGLDRNTLILFTSDNGPVDYGSPVPLRGRKTYLYEAGPRVPTIVSWPGRIAARSRSDQPAMTMDLLPTFAQLAGAALPQERRIDGTDLTGLLTGDQPLEPRLLFWEKPRGVQMHMFADRRWAVRDGIWKLQQERSGKPLELYDLAADPAESRDIAAAHPEVVRRLARAFEEWKADVYSDCPYDIEDLIARLREKGIIR